MKKRLSSFCMAVITALSCAMILPFTASAEPPSKEWLQFGLECIEAEADQKPLIYQNCGDHIVITGWNDIGAEFTIPAEIDGLPVTEIGSYAFYNEDIDCSFITKVHFPDTLTKIGTSAFQYCYNLTEVTLPPHLVSLGDDAFSCCNALASVTFPESLTEIGGEAFENTKWLETQKAKDTLVIVNGILIDGTNAAGAVTVPDSVTAISGKAFTDSKMTSVQLPSGLKTIGSYAFWFCRSLTEITIPDGVTEIADHAFWGCEDLWAVSIPESVTEIGACAFWFTNWLAQKQAVEQLVIRNGILIDGRNARGTVTIPDTVTKIASMAFHQAENVRSIIIPDTVTEIGSYAFQCSNMVEIRFPKSISVLPDGVCSGCEDLSLIALPKGLTEIGDAAFAYCAGYETLTLPDTLKIIGNDAFYCFGRLTALRIPDGVEIIKFHTFSCIPTLTAVTIPDSVKVIEGGAFENCPALTDVQIPASVTEIQYGAFSDTPWLAQQREQDPFVIVNGCIIDVSELAGNVTLPDGIRNVGHWFCKNNAVTAVTLPESVDTIPYFAFLCCDSLTEVTILNPSCDIYDHWTTICQGDYGEGEFSPENLTIRGYAGSTAQAYAEKYGYSFASLGNAPGDLDGNGSRDLKDVVFLRRMIAGGWDITADSTAADFNKDGQTDLKDVVSLRRKIAGGYA